MEKGEQKKRKHTWRPLVLGQIKGARTPVTSWSSHTPSLENRAAVTEMANKDGETTRATREVNGRQRMERECMRKGEVQRV